MNPVDQLSLWDSDYLGNPCPTEIPTNSTPQQPNELESSELSGVVADSKKSATGVRYTQDSIYQGFLSSVAPVADSNPIERENECVDGGMGIAPPFGAFSNGYDEKSASPLQILQQTGLQSQRCSGLGNGVRYDSATSATNRSVGGYLVDNFVQVRQPGAREKSGQIHQGAPLRSGVLEGNDGFLSVLAPDFKPDFEFRPGDILPPWAAEVLSSWPDLHPSWWENEDFQLSAAACGYRSRPGRRAGISRDPAVPAWEEVAGGIISGAIKVRNSTEFGALEIGIRALPGNRLCAEAARVIDETRESRRKKNENGPDHHRRNHPGHADP